VEGPHGGYFYAGKAHPANDFLIAIKHILLAKYNTM